jgi:hemerythrin-like domain-containing protein
LNSTFHTRRRFLTILGTGAGGLSGAAISALALPLPQLAKKGQEREKNGEEEVSPAEDLMREHGVLRRVLLVYDEVVRRITAKQDLDPELLAKSADIVKRFVEDYHEKQEEDYIFPRLKKAGKLTDLVDVLLQQHQEGRVVTSRIRTLSTAGALRSQQGTAELVRLLQAFDRMYRPHAAREDTVLFPGFRSVVSKNEYDSLGEQFEKNETRMFGQRGFEKFVDQVATIEKELGIYDLSQFTPKVNT